MRLTVWLLAAGAAPAVIALQFPHPGNILRNTLHERQPGAKWEARSLSPDSATEGQRTTVEPDPTAGPPSHLHPPDASSRPAPAPRAGPPPAQPADDPDPVADGRTLIVTRETSVYLPKARPTGTAGSEPAPAAPPRAEGPQDQLSRPTDAPREQKVNRRTPHILDTLRRLSFLGTLANWMLRKPTATAWWAAGLGIQTGWAATKWGFQTGWAAADWTWEMLVMPLFTPFLIPFHLFVLVPISLLTSLLIMLRPVFLLLSSASLLGLLLGFVGGFGSGFVGDLVYERSEQIMASLNQEIGDGQIGGPGRPGYLRGNGLPQSIQTPRTKGMVWAEKQPAWGDDEESGASDGEDSPEGWAQEARSPLFAGRPQTGARSASASSFTSARNTPPAGAPRRRGTTDSSSSAMPESPLEMTHPNPSASGSSSSSGTRDRRGSLIGGTQGRSPRPAMPKKKVTFDGTAD